MKTYYTISKTTSDGNTKYSTDARFTTIKSARKRLRELSSGSYIQMHETRVIATKH